MNAEALRATLQVVDALERNGIPYHLGGSLATSIHGIPRQTHDADFVARVAVDHVDALVGSLSDSFYIDGDMIREAIARRSAEYRFNAHCAGYCLPFTVLVHA